MSTEQVHHISKQQFMQIRVDFVQHMDDIKSFLDEALSNGLLIEGHRNEIMSKSNPDDQIRKLHDYIFKKLPKVSDKLMTALEKSKHIKIFDLLDEQTVYPMKFKPHGRVILINNVKFDDAKYPERLGSEKDVEGITKLFTAFNFDVQLYSNKTAEEMEDVILKEAAESTAREDCFVMFLMSHGVLGNIVGIDGEKLPYSTINTILQDSSQLKNKPKLIYVNACEANSDKEGKDGYFDAPDLYVFFSTVPGRLSYRTRDKGSYFIESLISVYERNKERCDIFALSDQIISQVSKKNEENSKEIYQNYEEFAQIPSGSHKLTKKVILRTTD